MENEKTSQKKNKSLTKKSNNPFSPSPIQSSQVTHQSP